MGWHRVEDQPGIYRDDMFTRYKAYADVLERDSRGTLHRRQITKTFREGDADEDGNVVDALSAAVSWKSARWAETTLQREQAKDLTVSDLFERFVASRPLQPSTLNVYTYVYAKHVAPSLGSWSLRNLDLHAVERWYADLDAGPEARAKAARLLRALTSFAYDRGMIPTDPARVLTVSGAGPRALRPDEIPDSAAVMRLATEVGERYRALVLLLAFGGLRIGEAVALRVDRVDLKQRRITVDASATEVAGRLTFGRPKTPASVRTFAAPRFLIDALRRHASTFPTETGLVFSGPDGGPLRPGNFRRRVFDPAVGRAGLDGLRIHDLRHACASVLASQGASATEIAARLGHSSSSTTARVYLHLLSARDERLAELQDQAFGATPESPFS
jgi:integrase